MIGNKTTNKVTKNSSKINSETSSQKGNEQKYHKKNNIYPEKRHQSLSWY